MSGKKKGHCRFSSLMRNKKVVGKRIVGLGVICLFLALCTGCSQQTREKPSSAQPGMAPADENGKTEDGVSEEAETSADKEGSRVWAAKVLVPEAPGTEVYGEGEILLDVSNASEGYVMLNYNGSNSKVKFQVTTPEEVTYTYTVTEYGSYKAYPLPGGDGNYGLTVYEVASEEKNLYAVALAQEIAVSIPNRLKTFLYPNCYVEFDASSACVKKGEELAKGCDTDLDVVASVYGYVTENISYDYDKAETVQPGYAPFPDNTLAAGTGICFDYASLMAAMLRSQQIPTRLEVGYVGDLYHAWLSCYIDEKGWVDDIIEFDGNGWTMMDPTMASSGGSKEVLRLEEESGYITKYVY